MRKISKTISIMMLMMMVIGLFPNVSFAKTQEPIQMSLTAEEMVFIVGGGGGGGGGRDPYDPNERTSGLYRREGLSCVNSRWELYRTREGGHKNGTSAPEPLTVSWYGSTTVRHSLSGNATALEFFSVKGETSWESAEGAEASVTSIVPPGRTLYMDLYTMWQNVTRTVNDGYDLRGGGFEIIEVYSCADVHNIANPRSESVIQ